MKQPIGDSRVVAGFQDQAVLVQLSDFPSGDGVFKLNSLILPENLGTSVDYEVRIAEGDLVIRATASDAPRLAVGEIVTVGIDATSCVVLAEDTP